MLHSLLLMIHHQEVSITQWVDLTRKDPLLALLAGFNPDNTPRIGTYYDFIDRLVDGPYQTPCDHIVKPSSLLPKKFLRSLKQESLQKKTPSTPTTPNRLVDQPLQNSDQPRSNDSLKLLEDLFIQLALIPSHQQGFVELKNLTVQGMVPSWNPTPQPIPNRSVTAEKKGSSVATVLNPIAQQPPPGVMTPTVTPSSSEIATTPWSFTKTTQTSPCSPPCRAVTSPTSPCR